MVSPYIRERNKLSTTRQIQHTTGVKDGPQPGQCHGHCQHGAGVQLGDGHHGDGWDLGHLPGWISDVESRKVNKRQNHIQAKHTDINYSVEDLFDQSRDVNKELRISIGNYLISIRI